jgi:hypothetical protein
MLAVIPGVFSCVFTIMPLTFKRNFTANILTQMVGIIAAILAAVSGGCYRIIHGERAKKYDERESNPENCCGRFHCGLLAEVQTLGRARGMGGQLIGGTP